MLQPGSCSSLLRTYSVAQSIEGVHVTVGFKHYCYLTLNATSVCTLCKCVHTNVHTHALSCTAVEVIVHASHNMAAPWYSLALAWDLAHDYHMTITWPSLNCCNIIITWPSHKCYKSVTWPSHDQHTTVARLSHDHLMTNTPFAYAHQSWPSRQSNRLAWWLVHQGPSASSTPLKRPPVSVGSCKSGNNRASQLWLTQHSLQLVNR